MTHHKTDRQCTATAKSSGERCKVAAVKGLTVCWKHGGAAKHARAAGARRVAAEKYEALDLAPTLAQLRADHLTRQLLELSHEDRKATIGGLIRLVDNLSDEEKATLATALQASNRSPGQLSARAAGTSAHINDTGPPSYANSN